MKKIKNEYQYREKEVINQFIIMLDSIEKEYSTLFNRVGEIDKETNDLLHDFEFDHFDRTRGHRKARHMQHIRQERRSAKERMEIIYPLKEYAKSNHRLRADLRRILSEMEKIKKEQNERVYTPRINQNIKIANKHYQTEDISKIEKQFGKGA